MIKLPFTVKLKDAEDVTFGLIACKWKIHHVSPSHLALKFMFFMNLLCYLKQKKLLS